MGFINVWDNMPNPIDNIRATQPWSDFVAHEIFPYKAFNPDHGHFVPNYLHTIGEGMLFRQLTEYYHREGSDYPRTSALLTLFSVQLLNEIVENSGHRGPNVDPIADLLIFNPLYYLLFALKAQHISSVSISGHLLAWPGNPQPNQPRALQHRRELHLSSSVRFAPSWALHLYGLRGSRRLSINSPEDRIQFGWGYRVVWLEDENAENPDIDARMMRPVKPGNWLIGFFWDRTH